MRLLTPEGLWDRSQQAHIQYIDFPEHMWCVQRLWGGREGAGPQDL